jgi:hypothetical protein
MCLDQPEESAVAKQRFEMGLYKEFSNTAILNKAMGYMDRLIQKATEIRLCPRNINRNGGFSLTWSWYLVTNILKQYQEEPIQRQDQEKQTYNCPLAPNWLRLRTDHRPLVGIQMGQFESYVISDPVDGDRDGP